MVCRAARHFVGDIDRATSINSTVLPFLYETWTLRPPCSSPLQQRWNSSKHDSQETRRPPLIRKHFAKAKPRSEIPLAVRTKPFGAQEDVFGTHRVSDQRSTNYESSHYGPSLRTNKYQGSRPFNDEEETPISSPSQRLSSITATEREAFEKAYKDLTGYQYLEPRAPKGFEEDHLTYAFPAGASSIEQTRNDLDEILGSILETPTDELQTDDEDIPFDWQPSHNEQVSGKDGDSELKAALSAATLSPQNLPGVTSAHLALHSDISTKLSEAPSSTAAWNILENNVFVLVKGLEENAPSVIKTAGTKRRGRPRKNPPPATSRERGARIHLASVIYGPLVLQAAQSFIYKYQEPERAFSLLKELKTLGPVSYIYGATTALYHELLWVKWKAFGDPLGVSELLTEMDRGGVQFDVVTRRLLWIIVRGDQKEDSVGYAAMNGFLGKEAMARLNAWLGIVRQRLREAIVVDEGKDGSNAGKHVVYSKSVEGVDVDSAAMMKA